MERSLASNKVSAPDNDGTPKGAWGISGKCGGVSFKLFLNLTHSQIPSAQI